MLIRTKRKPSCESNYNNSFSLIQGGFSKNGLKIRVSLRGENILGEIRRNNKGTLMKIIKYKNTMNIDIEFLDDFHYIKEHQNYSNFKMGCIRNPYDRTVNGVGYIGTGKYKPSINQKNTPEYNLWGSMIERCYCEKRRYRTKSYVDCEVCEEWHNFQNFAQWYHDNYYECDGRLQVDKDILVPGNRIYSPDNCLLIPQKINVLFINKPNNRGLPNGIRKIKNGYLAEYNENRLGVFKTIDEAYLAYTQRKKEEIIKVANDHKNIIPSKVYNAVISYEFKIENDKNYVDYSV